MLVLGIRVNELYCEVLNCSTNMYYKGFNKVLDSIYIFNYHSLDFEFYNNEYSNFWRMRQYSYLVH